MATHRFDDLINVGGIKVAPDEVERGDLAGGGRLDEETSAVLNPRRKLGGSLQDLRRQRSGNGCDVQDVPGMLVLPDGEDGGGPILSAGDYGADLHVEGDDLLDHAYILEMGRIVADGPGTRLATDSRVREAYLGL